MTARFLSRRATCVYCGEATRPNSVYCLACGQIHTTGTPLGMTFSNATLQQPTVVRHVELILADGQRWAIDGVAALGRNPGSSAWPPGTRCIQVTDHTMSVSRMHAIVELRGQQATVTDANSTNGSSVERAGTRLTLAPGRQTALENGDCLWLGSIPVEVRLVQN